MAGKLRGRKVAFVVTDGFEQVELTDPRKALEREGAVCDLIAPKEGKVRGWKHTEWGDELHVDVPLAQADPEEYDALVLPGGVMNPDKLRAIPEVLELVRRFFESSKVVGAICHGPWTLIDAAVVEGRKLTSFPALQTDLENAGAEWVDQEVVIDDNLVTSRKPEDIPAFSRALIDKISHQAPLRARPRHRVRRPRAGL
jgi:protease I